MTIQEAAEAYANKIIVNPEKDFDNWLKIKAAYLAGASESGSPKWVKASERPVFKEYFNAPCRRKSDDGFIYDEIIFRKDCWTLIGGNSVSDDDVEFINEWEYLDETPSPSVNDRIEKLEAALRELVELKWMKDTHFNLPTLGERLHDPKWKEYQKRKPLAWEAARNLVNPLPEDKK